MCRLGGLDLNSWFVSQRIGLAYRQFSTAYVAQEDAARAVGRDVHAALGLAPRRTVELTLSLHRTAAVRTVLDLHAAIRKAISQFTPRECRNYLAVAGYEDDLAVTTGAGTALDNERAQHDAAAI